MTFLDHDHHVVIGSHLAGWLVTQDVDRLVAGEHAGGDVPMRQALLGEEYQGYHDQCHMVMPSLLATGLIVGHAAGGLDILEGPFDEISIRLHASQSTQ